MFQAWIHAPQLVRWHARLTRVPKWGWIAFFAGAVIPIFVLVVLAVAAAVLTGAIVMIAVLLVGTVLGVVSRLRHLGRHDDGRRNVSIVVHSAHVIDP